MDTKQQIQSLYTGPKEDLPKPDDYLYQYMVALLPLISSFTIDDFGQPILTLKDHAQLTGSQLKQFFIFLQHHDWVRVDIAEPNRVRLIIS